MVRVGGLRYACDPRAKAGAAHHATWRSAASRSTPARRYKVAGWAPVAEEAKAAAASRSGTWSSATSAREDDPRRRLNLPDVVGMPRNPGMAELGAAGRLHRAADSHRPIPNRRRFHATSTPTPEGDPCAIPTTRRFRGRLTAFALFTADAACAQAPKLTMPLTTLQTGAALDRRAGGVRALPEGRLHGGRRGRRPRRPRARAPARSARGRAHGADGDRQGIDRGVASAPTRANSRVSTQAGRPSSGIRELPRRGGGRRRTDDPREGRAGGRHRRVGRARRRHRRGLREGRRRGDLGLARARVTAAARALRGQSQQRLLRLRGRRHERERQHLELATPRTHRRRRTPRSRSSGTAAPA